MVQGQARGTGDIQLDRGRKEGSLTQSCEETHCWRSALPAETSTHGPLGRARLPGRAWGVGAQGSKCQLSLPAPSQTSASKDTAVSPNLISGGFGWGLGQLPGRHFFLHHPRRGPASGSLWGGTNRKRSFSLSATGSFEPFLSGVWGGLPEATTSPPPQG